MARRPVGLLRTLWLGLLAVLLASLAGLAAVRPPSAAAAPRRTAHGPATIQLDGTFTAAHAVVDVDTTVKTPFVVRVPVRGRGGVVIDHAVVAGKDDTVVWEGGEPLGVIGGGGLVPGPVTVDIGRDGSDWRLDGAARALAPGRYHLGDPVAVGSSGLARTVDGLDFTAGPSTAMTGTGGAYLHRRPTTITLRGTGRLSISGQLTLTAGGRYQAVDRLDFGPGRFTLRIGPSGPSVDGTLIGPYRA